jgi:hypothetical protein
VVKKNYYSKAVENLQFSVCTNQQIIYTCSKFLKEVYLTISMTIENKKIDMHLTFLQVILI